MKDTFLPMAETALVGDFNPWPSYQAAGSVAIVGIFLALAYPVALFVVSA